MKEVYVQEDSVDEALGYFDSREIHDWEHSIIKRIEILLERHQNANDNFVLDTYAFNDICISTLIGGKIDYPYQGYLNYVRGRGFLNSNLVYDLQGSDNREKMVDLSARIRTRYYELQTLLQNLRTAGSITANFQALQNYWGKYFLDDPNRNQSIKIKIFGNSESYTDYIRKKYREYDTKQPYSRDDYHLEQAWKHNSSIVPKVDMELIVCDGSYSGKPGNIAGNAIIYKVKTDFPYDIEKSSNYLPVENVNHEEANGSISFDCGFIDNIPNNHQLRISDSMGCFDENNLKCFPSKNRKIEFDLCQLPISKKTVIAVHDLRGGKRISKKLNLLGMKHKFGSHKISFPKIVKIAPIFNQGTYSNSCRISFEVKNVFLGKKLEVIVIEKINQNSSQIGTLTKLKINSTNAPDSIELNDNDYTYATDIIRIKATYSDKNNIKKTLIGPSCSIQYFGKR